MNLLATLAQQFLNDTDNDGKFEIGEVVASMTNLLSGPDSPIDLGALVASMEQSGLGDIASSWLGDGDNLPISTQQIAGLFESDKLKAFAASLNIDTDRIAEELTTIIPQLVDRSSSGGQLASGPGGQFGEVMSQLKNLF